MGQQISAWRKCGTYIHYSVIKENGIISITGMYSTVDHQLKWIKSDLRKIYHIFSIIFGI
jgi:hypothetical protein